MSSDEEFQGDDSQSDQRTKLDYGIDALCQIVARNAVEKVTDAIAKLRGLSPEEYQQYAGIQHRVMSQFFGVMEIGLCDLEVFEYGDFRFHSFEVHEEFCDEALDDEFECECRCGGTFKTSAREVLEGRLVMCEDCAAAGSDCGSSRAA